MSSICDQSEQAHHSPTCMESRDVQVSLILKLLSSKGPSAAADIRQRIQEGRSVRARGQEFGSSILEEALRRWKMENAIPKTPAMPASWDDRVSGTAHAPREDASSATENAGEATASQPSAPSSRLKRKPAAPTVNSSPSLQAGSQFAASMEHTSASTAARKVGTFCQFLEASRKKSYAREGSEDKSNEDPTPHGQRSYSTADAKASFLEKTAFGIAATLRAVGTEPSADGDHMYATPCRSRAPSKDSPCDRRLSTTPTQKTESAIPAQFSPMPRHAQLSSMRKRLAPSKAPDLASPSRKQRPAVSSPRKDDPSPATTKDFGLPQSSVDRETLEKTLPRHAQLSLLRKRAAPSKAPDPTPPSRKQRLAVTTPNEPSPVAMRKDSGLPHSAADQETLEKTTPRQAQLSSLRKRAAPSKAPDPTSPPMKQRPAAGSPRKEELPPDTMKKDIGLSHGAADRETLEKSRAPPSEPAPEPFPDREATERSTSVKALKALLAEQGIDYSRCVEKAELNALWVRFTDLRKQPLASLQASCAALGGQHFTDADACARFLVSEGGAQEQQLRCSPQPQQMPRTVQAANSLQCACPARDKEADAEVLRIMSLRRESYRCTADWGFAVLGASHDASAVQRRYRVMMRKLHPDRVSKSDRVEKAIELIREAKDLCERNLLRVEAPSHPKCFRWEVLDQTPGRRRYRLCWLPPAERPTAPVRRYLVAALDPSYGKPLTITVLEPDYSEEQKRFVPIHELTSFVLAESELQKMPGLWSQHSATVQIAAANEAGQSGWSKLDVPLVSESSRPSLSGTFSPSSSCSDSSLEERSTFGHLEFETQLRRRSGSDLRSWLHGQLKAPLTAWLKTLRMPTAGTKDDLVERILGVMGFTGR